MNEREELIRRGSETLRHNIAMRKQVMEAKRATIRKLEEELFHDGMHLATLENCLLAARAIEASRLFPVGAKVRHHAFEDMTGEIAESDGTGIAVRQDATGDVVYGFGPEEWVLMEG